MTLQLAGFSNIKFKTQAFPQKRILKTNNSFWNYINNLLNHYSIIFNFKKKIIWAELIPSHFQMLSTLTNLSFYECFWFARTSADLK